MQNTPSPTGEGSEVRVDRNRFSVNPLTTSKIHSSSSNLMNAATLAIVAHFWTQFGDLISLPKLSQVRTEISIP